MQRRGQIKASPVGSVPSRDVPTVDPQSARIARWNVVDVRSAGSATTPYEARIFKEAYPE